MKINIDSLEVPYQFLRRYDGSFVETEELEETSSRDEQIPTFYYSTTQLPLPLENISLRLKRFNDKYSVIAMIDSSDDSGFLNLKSGFKQILQDNNYKFVPQNGSSRDCLGFIFDENDDCKFCITKFNNYSRVIGMGTFGTEPYHFPINEDEFSCEIKTLENVINMFMSCVFEPHLRKNNIKYLKNKILYISP